MTTALAPDIFDDTFQFAALRAYLEQASLCGGFPEESATKHRAYELYEQLLAETRAAAREKDFDQPQEVAVESCPQEMESCP